MMKRLSQGITVVVAAVMGMIFCHSLSWAYELQRSVLDDPSLKTPSSTMGGGIGFLLNFSQRYYDAVDNSLKEKSYFSFRYYLDSPFESFDKRQFIYENPTQANDIALRALHNALQRALEDIELVEYLRDRINGVTSFKMVFGAGGTRLHGPSLKGFSLNDSDQKKDSNQKMSLTSGLTFADDFKLGLAFTMTYHWLVSKLRYYPTLGNEIAYTAETQLTASAKIGLSYHRSKDGGDAVLTTLSFVF